MPFSKFSTAHASRIGILQSDVCQLLQANFVDPEVMKATDDVTSIDYTDPENLVYNDELGIGTSTRVLLCGAVEDKVVGTRVEARFLKVCVNFMRDINQVSL